MKTRYRVGYERVGIFSKRQVVVVVLQVFDSWRDGLPDRNGLPTYLAGSGWRDANVEDLMAICTKSAPSGQKPVENQ